MGHSMAGNIRKRMSSKATLLCRRCQSISLRAFCRGVWSYGPVPIVETAKEAATKAKVLIAIVSGAADVRKVFLDLETGLIAAS